MMRCFFILGLALLPQSLNAADGTPQEVCPDTLDELSLISVQKVASKHSGAATRNDTNDAYIPHPIYDIPQLRKVERRVWGEKVDAAVQQQATRNGLGDGRWTSMKPNDANELIEDREEETEIAVEKMAQAVQRNMSIAAGAPYFDPPATLLPLSPRVRGENGCLLDGVPKGSDLRPHLDRILVINLDSRPDRWNFVKNVTSFQHLGQVERHPGLRMRAWEDVDKLEDERREFVKEKIANTSFKWGLTKARDSKDPHVIARYFAKLSCFMSHYEAIVKLAKRARKGEIYLVMEDDFEMVRDLPGLLPDISWAVGNNWDAIRLDCWLSGESQVEIPNFRVVRTRSAGHMGMNYGGSQAILYRAESLWKIANYWRSEDFREADAMFWTDSANTYCVNWNIVRRAEGFGSNVNHAHAAVLVGGRPKPLDGYEAYLKQARIENPRSEEPTEEELKKKRKEHRDTCRKLRLETRMRLQHLVIPSEPTNDSSQVYDKLSGHALPGVTAPMAEGAYERKKA